MKKTLPLYLGLVFLAGSVYGQKDVRSELTTFATQTGATTTIDKATNGVSFIRFPTARAFKASGGKAEEKALAFVNQNRALFSMREGSDSYQVKESRKDQFGLEHVILQQYVQGVPVFDGLLRFHFNQSTEIASLNGNSISVEKLNVVPSIKQSEAEAMALKKVESQWMLREINKINGRVIKPLRVAKSTLYVFQKGLAQGYNGSKHLVYEIEVRNDADVREFMYIDAHTKVVVEQFTGMHASLDRRLYTASYNPASPNTNLRWKEGDVRPVDLSVWEQSEIESAGHIYYLMQHTFGRDSYDGAGAKMITTNNNPTIACPNANWNGVSANYCDNIASDDVVAHEWGHAYTEYTSGLVYAYQAGALNESYSDIWGETVDLINGYFDANEGTGSRSRNGTDNPIPTVSTRWRVGEKASANVNADAAIRDMYNPNNFNQPGKVSDVKYYCGDGDEGGVHYNSGVLNHAYALLVDGGEYNGQSITGIGLMKAAHIYWYAQTHFMSATTDFVAMADILEASAQALIDAHVNLPTLTTTNTAAPLSNAYITLADLAELKKTLLAVELGMEEPCDFGPFFATVDPLCTKANAANAFFFEDFENGLGSWTLSYQGSTATWTVRNWVVKDVDFKGHTGKVGFGTNPALGNCTSSNDQTGTIMLMSPVISIPSDANPALEMAFDHYVSIEQGWDGGILRYKLGSGVWTTVPVSAFLVNGYNTTLNSASAGSSNVYAGQRAFSGPGPGTYKNEWGQSRINLQALGMTPGKTIQFGWVVSTDCGYGYDGWYIDDVRVYSCSDPTVSFVTAATVASEGEGNMPNSTTDCLPYVDKTVQIRINQVPAAAVTVTLNTSGSATKGELADYTVFPNSFILDANHLVQDVIVRIFNDGKVEGTEKVELDYTIATTGLVEVSPGKHTVVINDDDWDPADVPVELLNANFNDGLVPSGWVIADSDNDGVAGEYPHEWSVRTNSPSIDGTPLLIADSDEYGGSLNTWSVETAPMNTVGLKDMKLSFQEFFRTYSGPGDYNETAKVEVWDGTSWRLLLLQEESTGSSGSDLNPATRELIIPDTYSNVGLKIRFEYNAKFDYYWLLDNIKVTAKRIASVASAISAAPAEEYLGPFEKVHFYDPSTRAIIATIENLTAHDYGCTQVQVDRAGIDATPWVLSYKVTNKTVKVTPTVNNPQGQYKITLYFKDSELVTFSDAAIKSMGKSAGGIGAGNAANSSYAEVYATSIYGSDLAYTATFDSGFSGFGLSDAPPIGSLPVKLVKFVGSHGVEGNVLKWETSSEENNEYFAVERASDAKRFMEIGRVEGSGNSAITNRYQYIDTKFAKGINYYRLKQVDRDGSRAYSNIVPIDALNLRTLKFFPNPVQAILNIELPDVDMKLVSFKIINISGKIVMNKTGVKTSQGAVSQDVSHLGTGLYQVIISDGTSTYNFSVVKM